MKKKFINVPLCLTLVLLILGGCGGKNKADNNSQEIIEVIDFLEPDNYFEEAFTFFEEGDREATVDMISAASEFIQSIVIKNDTFYSPIIEVAVNKLGQLSEDILNGEVTSSDQLGEVFSSINRSVGMYHLLVIEDWVINETNNDSSLNRMHHALVRMDYALEYVALELTEFEKAELTELKEDVLKAEKATDKLWERSKKKLNELNKLLEENENSLDGTL